MRIFAIGLVLTFSCVNALADDEGNFDGAIEAPVPRGSSGGSSPSFGMGFGGRTFQNVAYNLAGQLYSVDLRLSRPGDWQIGLEAPYIEGTNTGRHTNELGNVSFHSRFNIWELGDGFSLWIPFSVRIGQKGKQAVIASHHDTYRLGAALEYRNGRVESRMEAAYSLRAMEEDPQWDVGNVADVGMSLRYVLTGKLAATMGWDWYRVEPVKFQKKEVGSQVDWSTVSPGLEYRLSRGVDLKSYVAFPLLQSSTPYETDMALVEVYYPYASSVTFGWGLGAHF